MPSSQHFKFSHSHLQLRKAIHGYGEIVARRGKVDSRRIEQLEHLNVCPEDRLEQTQNDEIEAL